MQLLSNVPFKNVPTVENAWVMKDPMVVINSCLLVDGGHLVELVDSIIFLAWDSINITG
jgi:hypothetical protein